MKAKLLFGGLGKELVAEYHQRGAPPVQHLNTAVLAKLLADCPHHAMALIVPQFRGCHTRVFAADTPVPHVGDNPLVVPQQVHERGIASICVLPSRIVLTAAVYAITRPPTVD